MPDEPSGAWGKPGAPRPAELAALAVLGIAGQSLAAALTVVLSVHMMSDAFAAYARSISMFLLAKAVVPLGMDRLALQVLPGLHLQADRSKVDGFWRVALRRTAVGTGLGMSGMFGLGYVMGDLRTMMVAALGLPVVAVVQLLTVQAILLGRPVLAAFASRVLPSLFFALVVTGFLTIGRPLAPVDLLLAWGVGWVVGGTWLWFGGVRVAWKRGVTAFAPQLDHADGFVLQSLSLTTIRRAPVIMSGYLAPAAEVAPLVLSFAFADIVGTLATLINGPFLRQGAHLAAQGDIRQQRLLFVWHTWAFVAFVMLPTAILVGSAIWGTGQLTAEAGRQDPVVLVAVMSGSTALAFSGFHRKMLVRGEDQAWKLHLLVALTAMELVLLLPATLLAGAVGAATAFAVTAIAVATMLMRRAVQPPVGQ